MHDLAQGRLRRDPWSLDRRYSNIPGWQPLKDAGWLARAAETCATLAGYDEPDYTIDLRGWQRRRTLVEGPGLPGLNGVLQAQHNLLVHLGEFPDARSLRLVLDSQRIVSRDAATFDPHAATDWGRRASTYLRLIHATNDIGGMVGNSGPAAGESALAARRIEQFTRSVHAGTATADSGPLRHHRDAPAVHRVAVEGAPLVVPCSEDLVADHDVGMQMRVAGAGVQ